MQVRAAVRRSCVSVCQLPVVSGRLVTPGSTMFEGQHRITNHLSADDLLICRSCAFEDGIRGDHWPTHVLYERFISSPRFERSHGVLATDAESCNDDSTTIHDLSKRLQEMEESMAQLRSEMRANPRGSTTTTSPQDATGGTYRPEDDLAPTSRNTTLPVDVIPTRHRVSSWLPSLSTLYKMFYYVPLPPSRRTVSSYDRSCKLSLR